MKKLLAVLLALLMLCAASCSAEPPTAEAPSPPPSASESPSPSPESKYPSGEMGMYDPEYDYNQNPRYKVTYYSGSGAIYKRYSDSLSLWCSHMSMDYTWTPFGGYDAAEFIDGLIGLAADSDGLFVDCVEQCARCAEVLDELGCKWLPVLCAPRDETVSDAPLLHPYYMVDDYEVGRALGQRLLNIKAELWGDIDDSEFCFASLTVARSEALSARERGWHDVLMEADPSWGERYYTLDLLNNTLDTGEGFSLTYMTLTQHQEYAHWLICAPLEDAAAAALRGLELAGLTQSSAVVSVCGDIGQGILESWESGASAFKGCYCCPTALYTEPIAGGMYLMLTGEADAKTLWIEHKSASSDYAIRTLPCYWVDADNYRRLLKWTDIYSGANYYPEYPSDGLERDSYATSAER